MASSSLFERLDTAFDATLQRRRGAPRVREVGQMLEVGEEHGIVGGLPDVRIDELVELPGERLGLVLDLAPDRVGVIALDPMTAILAGDRVTRTGRVMDVPVGAALIGRVVDAAGRPLDGKGPVRAGERSPIERDAPAILDRSPVSVPLQSGIKVVDALIPIGRGQRELIVGDRQTGKTAIAVDTIVNQADEDVTCVYCAIGQRTSAVANVVTELREAGAMEHTIVVVATGEDPPGMQYLAPYSAMTMGEHFMGAGKDVLLVLDDLTRHARAYRELSLLLRRPPGREAYPGDIFYVHARLLERATHLCDDLGGGSLTALPIVETQAQNISAYIPTNLISITDGQIYVSTRLFKRGVLPAVDVGRSVSRVGGDAQLPAYKGVTGDLRLAYSQFEELEQFTRFGARLEEDTRQTLEHGRRIRELFKQEQSSAVGVIEQISVLMAAVEGVFDEVPLDSIPAAERRVRESARDHLGEVAETIRAGEEPGHDERERILDLARQAVLSFGDHGASRDGEEGGADGDD